MGWNLNHQRNIATVWKWKLDPQNPNNQHGCGSGPKTQLADFQTGSAKCWKQMANYISTWVFPKMVGFPNNHGVFLLKMIILGCEMGVPPFKETPIYYKSCIISHNFRMLAWGRWTFFKHMTSWAFFGRFRSWGLQMRAPHGSTKSADVVEIHGFRFDHTQKGPNHVSSWWHVLPLHVECRCAACRVQWHAGLQSSCTCDHLCMIAIIWYYGA